MGEDIQQRIDHGDASVGRGTGDKMHPLVFTGDFLPTGEIDFPPELQSAQVVSNLECVITASAAKGEKAYSVVLPTHAIENLERGQFAALSVANNHALDAGVVAFYEMLRMLKDGSSAHVFGTRQVPFAELHAGPQKCAVIGCLEKCRSRGRALFPQEHVTALIRELSPTHPLIYVVPHWGKEGEYAFHPSPAQQKYARQWIDAGASGVFGHHPHVIQGRHEIDGLPVYYSLGNLWFPHAESAQWPATQLGLAVRVDPKRGGSMQEHFLRASENGLRAITDRRDQLERWLDRLSVDLVRGRRSRTVWARAVGEIYITKSERSWRKRLCEYGGIKTRLLNLIWNLTPTTLLMRFGKLFPDEYFPSAGDDLLRILSTRCSSTVGGVGQNRLL